MSQMYRDPRIKKVGKGEFRSRLAIEDVTPTQFDKLYEVINSVGKYEKILVMHQTPIPSPMFQYLFYTKASTLNDGYLRRLVVELMYLNEGLTRVGLKKLVEFVGRSFVRQDKDGVPVLTYEELYPFCEQIVRDTVKGEAGAEVYGDKTVLFERGTMLSGTERKEISSETRAFRNSYLKKEIIHNKAIQIVNRNDLFGIKKRDVHNEVKTEKGLKTYKSFVTHTANKTVKILEDTLELRKFRSQKEVEQFEVYKVYREKEMTTAEMVKKMKVSYGTLSFFSSLLKKSNQ